VNTPPLLVLYDAKGGITDTGDRGPLWSSDCRPASTLKGLCAELLQAGWPLSTMLKLPDDDDPVRFSDVYKKEFGRLPGRAFGQFQREQKAREWAQNNGDPYGLRLPSGATSGARPNYGTTTKI
jgi:hypothetical protein